VICSQTCEHHWGVTIVAGYLGDMKWAFETLSEWLQSAQARENYAKDLFLDALTETNIYLGRLKNPNARDRMIEEKLSRLWTKAAAAVREFDEDVYQRCIAKACSWADIERFAPGEIYDVNVSIEEMLRIAGRLGR